MNDKMWKKEAKVSIFRLNNEVFECLVIFMVYNRFCLCCIVIMPPSALDQLTRLNVVYPMLFKLINSKKSRITHAGVLEFVADEGKIYIPYWVSYHTEFLAIFDTFKNNSSQLTSIIFSCKCCRFIDSFR